LLDEHIRGVEQVQFVSAGGERAGRVQPRGRGRVPGVRQLQEVRHGQDPGAGQLQDQVQAGAAAARDAAEEAAAGSS
jgi:hypothetical protein